MLHVLSPSSRRSLESGARAFFRTGNLSFEGASVGVTRSWPFVSPAEFTKARLNSVPLGRMETPEDVANVIGFPRLAEVRVHDGPSASVDGGLVMH